MPRNHRQQTGRDERGCCSRKLSRNASLTQPTWVGSGDVYRAACQACIAACLASARLQSQFDAVAGAVSFSAKLTSALTEIIS